MMVKFVVPALCSLALPWSCAAHSSPASASNPYSVISAGNPFRLRPPPAPVIIEPPPPVLPEIKVSGFVVTGNKVRALFASSTKNPKEAPIYYDLAEGETEGILKLVKINLADDEADIVNSGVPMHVSLRENGFQVPAANHQPIATMRPGSHVPPIPPRFAVSPN